MTQGPDDENTAPQPPYGEPQPPQGPSPYGEAPPPQGPSPYGEAPPEGASTQGWQQQPPPEGPPAQGWQQPPPPGWQQPPPGPYGYPPHPGAPYGIHPITGIPYSDKSKVVAGVLQLVVPLGIGRFYIGDTNIGIAQLLVTLVTCGIGALWPFIDGILILVNDDAKDAQGRPLRPS